MKRLMHLLPALFLAVTMSAGEVTYTADDELVFPNPERGFIVEIGGKLSSDNFHAVKGQEAYLESMKAQDGISMVLVMYYLDNYRNSADLPRKLISSFDEDMQVLRDLGLKGIIRFAYTSETYGEEGNESAHDASLETVLSHINLYKSRWQNNADVIFTFQAGYVGAWGEWYYSDHFGNQCSTINDSRRALVDALLAAVPKDRCIQMRTPLFKTGYIGSTAPLTAEEAFTGTAKARLGHHNDAFLENHGNLGTYTDTATQKPYIAQETLYVPIGGESCILDPEIAETNASYEKTTAEMSRLHWTFISCIYSELVTGKWRDEGTFDELNRKLGYRFQLVNGTFSDEVEQGGKLSVKIKLRNAGYAPLYNARPAYLVLKAVTGESSAVSLPLSADPRRWLPNGVVSTVEEELTIPSDLPEGTYELYLHLPDAYATLAEDPRYAVRFANSGVWEPETGMNKLNTTVKITAPSDPDPVAGDAVLLPGTLAKTNVSATSEDMSWYQTELFDFGPEDAPNTERWAEWQVELRYPGSYLVSAEGFYPNGHQWQLEMENSGAASFALPASWAEGEQTEYGDHTWDLSRVEAGTYALRVRNIMEWGRPKLRSLTMQYDGDLPAGQAYSRCTDSRHKEIRNGRLLIIRDRKVYTPQGQSVK